VFLLVLSSERLFTACCLSMRHLYCAFGSFSLEYL
jgi:hypothetical protein